MTYLSLNLNPESFRGSTLSILCRESCLPVSWCIGDRCGMAGSDKDHGRSRRPGVEDQRWSSAGRVLSGQMIERSSDSMGGLHRA
jgi:hypothetical protein